MSTFRRGTAYGLEAPRDADWRRQGLCGRNPDLWFGGQFEAERAAHLCRWHCPVLEQCLKEAQIPSGGIWGGVRWTDGTAGRPPRPAKGQPAEVGPQP